MAVLGKGEANGAISLLHAAGLGYGASLAIDLPLIVRLLDSPYKTQPDDQDDILGHTIRIWQDNGYTLPAGGFEILICIMHRCSTRTL